jgi:type 1 fimbriae regulatory protein FimB
METARKYLTEEEFKRLIGVIKDPRDRAIFVICYWRGLRASEIGKLVFSSWRRSAKRIYIERLKGSLAGEFPLSSAEQRALNAWVKVRGTEPGALFPSRESGVGRRGIGRKMLHVLMRRYALAAAIPIHLRHMHALKHSCGTHLIAKGLDVLDVKDWLGHKDIRSTMKYLEYRNKQRDEAARKIYGQE